MTDWKALCLRMADEIDDLKDRLDLERGCGEKVKAHPLVTEARAALTQPEPEGRPAPAAAAGLCELADDLREQASQGYCEFISREDLRRVADVLEQLAVSAHKQEPAVGPPSDDELLELAQHHSVSYTMSDGSVVYPLQQGCDMRDDVLSFARAVLARYGHQPAPPAQAEMADGPAVPESREPASVVGEPSDEEIMELMPQQMHEDLAAAVRAMAEQEGIDSTPAKGVMRIILNRHIVDLARAVLARWGHQPAPPAAGADCPACEGVPKPGNQPCAVCGRSASSAGGEVAELAWWLRSLEDASVWFESGSPEALKLTRAADLLEQRHPTPVPVSERLPGAEDCDGEGMCWWWRTDDADEWWEFLCITDAREYNAGCGSARYTHWLPAHALPLPSCEVEA